MSHQPLFVGLLTTAAFGLGVGVAYVFFRRGQRGLVLELRSLWERLDAIFYRSPLAVSLCERDREHGGLRVIDCNERAWTLHGGTREQLLATAVPVDVAGEEECGRINAWLEAPRPVAPWHGEMTLRRFDGTDVPVAYVWSRVEIGDRELILAVERDISEQRRAEAALKDSEQRFRQIVASANCLLWKAQVREPEGGGRLEWKFEIPISALRQRLFDAAGVPMRDGVLWSKFTVPELPEMNERCRAALRRGDASYRQEFRMILPRETVWLQEQVEIQRLGEREWNLVGVIVDITRLKEAEAATKAGEELNRLVLQASNDGIWDYDVAAGRMTASERCRQMLGLTPADLPARVEGWRDRIHPEDLPVEEAAWKNYRETGEPCVYQARFRHQDGSWRWFMVCAIAITDATGGLLRVVGSHTDISELKRSDGELQQSRRLRAIGELVGGIAHEFNNLLTPMLLQTTMMKEGQAPGADLKEQLKPVISAITQARELTQRILTFGRRTSVNPETIDFAAVVIDHLELLRHTIDRRVRLNLRPVPEPLWVSQNRTDLAQIVINLVLNARDTLVEKASGRPPAAWVPAIDIEFATVDDAAGRGQAGAGEARTGRWHRLTVRDNGMGMTDKVRERIFEPFYTTKEVGQGTGLGLATVWHLIKTVGGQVEVDTRAGEGSAFHISLPAVKAPVSKGPTPAMAGPAAARPAAVPPGAARILVAEDQPEVALTLTRILERWGHGVTSVPDGMAAIRTLRERPADFDVCITDLNMPGATGFEVARAIRDAGLNIKVAVMGGYLTAEVRRSLDELKIDALIAKPFAIEDIATAMRTCGW